MTPGSADRHLSAVRHLTNCATWPCSKGPDYRQKFSAKNGDYRHIHIFSYPSVLTFVLVAQKNQLIEIVLLSTNNICFG